MNLHMDGWLDKIQIYVHTTYKCKNRSVRKQSSKFIKKFKVWLVLKHCTAPVCTTVMHITIPLLLIQSMSHSFYIQHFISYCRKLWDSSAMMKCYHQNFHFKFHTPKKHCSMWYPTLRTILTVYICYRGLKNLYSDMHLENTHSICTNYSTIPFIHVWIIQSPNIHICISFT